MPEYLSPGVYVEEIEIGAKPIEGVSTSTAGFLGEAERGPTTPKLVTSWLDYQRKFGGYFEATKYLPNAVEGFFNNGGQRCYIARIVKAGAAAASLSLTKDNASALTLSTTGEGEWGNRVAVKIGKGSLNGFRLRAFYWKQAPNELFDPDAEPKKTPRPMAEELFDNLSLDDTSPDFFEKKINGVSNLIELKKGSADSGVMPELGHEGTAQTGPAATPATIKLASTASSADDFYNGMEIEITAGKGLGQKRTITDYVGTTKVASVDSDWDADKVPDATSQYRIVPPHHEGTAQAGGTTTISLANDAYAADDSYNGMTIEITANTGSGQTATISDYVGGTKVATVSPAWTTAPDATSTYSIKQEGTAQSGTAVPLPASIKLDNGKASSTNDAYNGMDLEITDGTGKSQKRRITDYVGSSKVATVDPAWDKAPDNTSKYRLAWPIQNLANGYDYAVKLEGTAAGGGASTITLPNAASGDNSAYLNLKIKITAGTGVGQTRKITAYDGATKVATVDTAWTTQPAADSDFIIFDDAIKLADYQRSDTDQPGKRKGLIGMREIDEISILYSPNPEGVAGLTGALINECETLKDRFAVIDCAQAQVTVSTLKPRDTHDTKYAAFYYPWIKVLDPQSGARKLVPPGGYVAGIYARSDIERGVHKAPANETVRGAVELEFNITKGEQDILNPIGVNVIRAFPGRGIRVWGARTLSSDALWKYINVRRLFIFLEESIEEGTQWVVFEPNDERLWARVRQTITQFLTRVWRDGALMGTTPEEAFFVKCDRSTMTQDDIDNGRLIVLIGVAPVKPAEFVIFRIAQWTGGSEVTE